MAIDARLPGICNDRSASVTPGTGRWVRRLRTGELTLGEDDAMHVIEDSAAKGTVKQDPVQAARIAIWRLFQEGYVDEDMATAGLLAVDLGTRRAQRNAPVHASGRDGARLRG
jgi:hypothetical protein